MQGALAMRGRFVTGCYPTCAESGCLRQLLGTWTTGVEGVVLSLQMREYKRICVLMIQMIEGTAVLMSRRPRLAVP